MARLGSLDGHHGDTTTARLPFGNCLNCGQELLIVSLEGNEASILSGVVAFTSFVKNEKTQVFMRNAVKEVYSILHVIELENDADNCALCVDCSLVFAQLFGLFQTFESRRKPQGFLDVALTEGVRRASEFTRKRGSTGVQGNEETAQDDFSSEFDTLPREFGADERDPTKDEIQACELASEEAARTEVISSPEHQMEDGHPADDCDDVTLASGSDNNDDESVQGGPECGPSEEASEDEDSKAGVRPAKISELNSIHATGDVKTRAVRSENSVKRPRRLRPMDDEGQLATNVNVTEANERAVNVAESDYGPTSDDSDSDDDGPPKTQPSMKYKCADCSEELPFPSVLASHRKKVHGASELYKCQICFATLRQGHSLTTHLRRHEKIKLSETKTYTEAEKIYKCIDCDEKFPLASHLRRHRVDSHGADGANQHVLVCHICRYSTNHSASFKSHFALHASTEVHKCSQCRKKFNLFRKLRVHMKTQHRIMLLRNHNHRLDPLCDKKIILRCRKCEAEFDCEARLLEHSKTEHGDGSFRCNICKSSFFQEHTLRRHMLEHGKCRFCDKRYKSRKGRKLHEQNAHPADSTLSRQTRSETSASDTVEVTK